MDHPLRKARKRCGLTQGRLGELSGVTFSAISNIENRIRIGRPRTLQALAPHVGIKNWRRLQEDSDVRR